MRKKSSHITRALIFVVTAMLFSSIAFALSDEGRAHLEKHIHQHNHEHGEDGSLIR